MGRTGIISSANECIKIDFQDGSCLRVNFMYQMQMFDLPADDEGLSWIVSMDPTKLLLIPGLQPSSIAASAAGDQQALAYLRFTAQHFAAYAGTRNLNPLDRACLAASKVKDKQAHHAFLDTLKNRNPQLARVFNARQCHTLRLLKQAARAGEVSAIKWMQAICPPTFSSRSLELMLDAARNGCLEVLKYLQSRPNPEPWDQRFIVAAGRHLECLKWLLSADAPGGPCPCGLYTLASVAKFHGLAALQWFHAHCQLSATLWNCEVTREAAEAGDQAMLEWLRAQSPPVPWDAQVCKIAATRGDISMLSWLRNQIPPAPWDEESTEAAADLDDMRTLVWLRAQDPPCPWDASSCEAAAGAGLTDTLVWLRAQNPPCPFSKDCTDLAAWESIETLQWLLDNGCPIGPKTTMHVSALGDVAMLKRLRSAGASLHSLCPSYAAHKGHLPVLEWLSEQGIQLDELYFVAARIRDNLLLKFLHERKVPPKAGLPRGGWGPQGFSFAQPMLMFLADIGMQLPPETWQRVTDARRAHCTFHGLVRWCRRAISDPSRGSHRAFDFMAADGTGQLLLTRLCLLPPELISKIAVAAQLQHDIFDLPAQALQLS